MIIFDFRKNDQNVQIIMSVWSPLTKRWVQE